MLHRAHASAASCFACLLCHDLEGKMLFVFCRQGQGLREIFTGQSPMWRLPMVPHQTTTAGLLLPRAMLQAHQPSHQSPLTCSRSSSSCSQTWPGTPHSAPTLVQLQLEAGASGHSQASRDTQINYLALRATLRLRILPDLLIEQIYGHPHTIAIVGLNFLHTICS